MSTEAFDGSGIRRWLVALLLLSLIGAGDCGYLLWKHWTGGSSFCQAGGCDLVTQGEYAVVSGIPLATVGLVGYLALLALSGLAAVFGSRRIVGAIIAISGIGVLVSAFLLYLQVAVIRAICAWCILSAFTIASIFILSVLLLRQLRYQERLQSAE
jgi:uncharacterized membrane protein